ncbi:DNA (cytosine-5-)-methyltransferase [Spongiibacter sp. KMU-158]|uniref:Cytosine-specific methyltransferase n=1 Tax=Spongiibacter pelagi TaxID=2760804 RepID=A0A927C554_9GAMM|nr:DNA (cytosine-5-)-methyltransferase [Spongiibacter pelagi]MBD2860348.1 DNA (cytosine-5-)-methyltransferase [Spongiibacter pelagi]
MNNVQKLEKLHQLLGEDQLSELLGISNKTLKNWLKEKCIPKESTVAAKFDQILDSIPNPQRTGAAAFSFIDLFAGIGGIRRGFESIGGECVFTSEWDKYSQITYRKNYSEDHHPVVGDITKIDTALIPDHDVLLAGFPCQPFSLAGVSKKNSLGRAHGFECNTQGTLFFDVERIIAAKKPKAFLLENVKNLMSHDKGKTFKVITQTLEEKLGYKIFYKVIDANGFVPQNRQRIFIVGFRDDVPFSWAEFQQPEKGAVKMRNILHPENGKEAVEERYTVGPSATVRQEFILSTKLWKYLQDYKKKHEKAGNGFGFGLVNGEDTCRTLSARYHKDGSEILISRGQNKNPRRLTPRECARLMGYPDSLEIPVSNTQAYRQFGNSVVVPVIAEIARIMKPHIMELVAQDCRSLPEQQNLWQIA